MSTSFSELALKVFRPLIGQARKNDDLSDPIPVRLPKLLLAEIEAQAESIGGSRYRSKHLINLLYMGSNFYRTNSDFIRGLSPEQFSLITRINYVFDIRSLQPTKVAESLGFKDPQKVTGWLNGTIYPEFKELELFSEKYFINANWLKHGNESGNMVFTPYLIQHGRFSRDYEQMFNDLINIFPFKIQTARLIRSTSGNILISLDFSEKRYISVYYPNLRLNKINTVGGTGFADLVAFSAFCRFLDKYMTAFLTISYIVSDEHFDLIRTGQAIPDELGIWGQQQANHWYETIHSQTDTQDHSDKDFWNGAIELFGNIQADPEFNSKIIIMDNKESEYIKLNYEYKERS